MSDSMSLNPATIWRARDGRLWSLARLGPIPADDPAFAALSKPDAPVTSWPERDGQQTQAALDEVLAYHGVANDLAAYAAQVRFARETGGIEIGGERIKTDRESQALIAGAHALALAEPDEPVEFKGESGWVRIDAAGMILIGLAVGRHVRDCFRRESAVTAALAAGTITTRAEIDAVFAA